MDGEIVVGEYTFMVHKSVVVKKRKNRKISLLTMLTFEKCEKWSEEDVRLALKESMEEAVKDLVNKEVFCIPQEFPVMFKKKCVGKFQLLYH